MRKILFPIILLCLLLGIYHWRKDMGTPEPIDSITVVNPDTVAVKPERTTKLHIDGQVYQITPDWVSLEQGKGWGINGTITEVIRKRITVYGVPYCYRSDFFSDEDIAELGRRGILLTDPHKTLTAYRLLCDTLCGSGIEVLQAHESPSLSQEQIDRLSQSGVDAVLAYNSPFLSPGQIDTLNSSTSRYGVADIWLVAFKQGDDAERYFVILDKITMQHSEL